jgi:hypothetical protein
LAAIERQQGTLASPAATTRRVIFCFESISQGNGISPYANRKTNNCEAA